MKYQDLLLQSLCHEVIIFNESKKEEGKHRDEEMSHAFPELVSFLINHIRTNGLLDPLLGVCGTAEKISEQALDELKNNLLQRGFFRGPFVIKKSEFGDQLTIDYTSGMRSNFEVIDYEDSISLILYDNPKKRNLLSIPLKHKFTDEDKLVRSCFSQSIALFQKAIEKEPDLILDYFNLISKYFYLVHKIKTNYQAQLLAYYQRCENKDFDKFVKILTLLNPENQAAFIDQQSSKVSDLKISIDNFYDFVKSELFFREKPLIKNWYSWIYEIVQKNPCLISDVDPYFVSNFFKVSEKDEATFLLFKFCLQQNPAWAQHIRKNIHSSFSRSSAQLSGVIQTKAQWEEVKPMLFHPRFSSSDNSFFKKEEQPSDEYIEYLVLRDIEFQGANSIRCPRLSLG